MGGHQNRPDIGSVGRGLWRSAAGRRARRTGDRRTPTRHGGSVSRRQARRPEQRNGEENSDPVVRSSCWRSGRFTSSIMPRSRACTDTGCSRNYTDTAIALVPDAVSAAGAHGPTRVVARGGNRERSRCARVPHYARRSEGPEASACLDLVSSSTWWLPPRSKRRPCIGAAELEQYR